VLVKSDVVVKRVGLLSFNKCSLLINSGETYHCCATLHSFLVGDIGFCGVVIGESTSNIGYHFLNIMSKIGLEQQIFALVLLKIRLTATFFLRLI
jgi:hypothetical protein